MDGITPTPEKEQLEQKEEEVEAFEITVIDIILVLAGIFCGWTAKA